jgi:hypothetical protein
MRVGVDLIDEMCCRETVGLVLCAECVLFFFSAPCVFSLVDYSDYCCGDFAVVTVCITIIRKDFCVAPHALFLLSGRWFSLQIVTNLVDYFPRTVLSFLLRDVLREFL